MPERAAGFAMVRLDGEDDGPRAGGTGAPLVTGQQMFDEHGETFVFQAVQVGVFEEIEVAGATDSLDFADDAESVEAKLVEFFAGGG